MMKVLWCDGIFWGAICADVNCWPCSGGGGGGSLITRIIDDGSARVHQPDGSFHVGQVTVQRCRWASAASFISTAADKLFHLWPTLMFFFFFFLLVEESLLLLPSPAPTLPLPLPAAGMCLSLSPSRRTLLVWLCPLLAVCLSSCLVFWQNVCAFVWGVWAGRRARDWLCCRAVAHAGRDRFLMTRVLTPTS